MKKASGFRLRPLRITAAVLTVAASLFLNGCTGLLSGLLSLHGDPSGYDTYPHTIKEELGFEIYDDTAPLEVEYFFDNSFDSSTCVYDAKYLHMIFDSAPVSKSDLLGVLAANPNISDKYKACIREYIDLLYARYPNNNYRIFYENLKTMTVYECEDKWDLAKHTLSIDAYACYVAMENTVYTLSDYDYKKGTWDYQVIMHEFSHALRSYRNDDTKKQAQFGDTTAPSVILEEAMNSVFTVSLFDYEERDIAYQFQSNIIQAIVESMDNYDLNDYVNHSSSYFVRKLDEFTGYTNYALTMLKVMETQYDDYHREDYVIKEEEFYPFYRYICDIYFKNRITGDMTDGEKEAVLEELTERIMFDVPEEYHVDTDYFRTYFYEYTGANRPDLAA